MSDQPVYPHYSALCRYFSAVFAVTDFKSLHPTKFMNIFRSSLILRIKGLFYSKKSSKIHKNCIHNAIKCSCAGFDRKKLHIQYREKSLISYYKSVEFFWFQPCPQNDLFRGPPPPIVQRENFETALFRIRRVVQTFWQLIFSVLKKVN